MALADSNRLYDCRSGNWLGSIVFDHLSPETVPLMSFTSPEMLELLRCPESGSKLTLLKPEQIVQLNQVVKDKKLCDRSGQVVSAELESAAINEDLSWIYPVRGGIISLIKDKAIAGPSQLGTTQTEDGTTS